MKIKLEAYEIYMAAMVGMRRRISIMAKTGFKNTNKTHSKDFGWHTDIEAACAEMVVAKFLGMYWDYSVDTFKVPDVGGIQVRHTAYDTGCLVIRDADSNDEIFLLVTGSSPEYFIRGWVTGYSGKKDEYLRYQDTPGGEAWFVPQESLRNPMELNKNDKGDGSADKN